VVYFPAGSYKCTSQVDFGLAACIIKGDGWASNDPTVLADNHGSFLYSTLTTGNAFTVGENGSSGSTVVQGIVIRDLAIVSASPYNPLSGSHGNTTTGLSMRPTVNQGFTLSNVENVWLEGFFVGLNPGDGEECVYRDIYATSNGTGILINGTVNSFSFNNNFFYNVNCQNNNIGMDIQVGANLSFFGGIAQGNYQIGMRIKPRLQLSGINAVETINIDGWWFEGNNGGVNGSSLGDIVFDVTTETPTQPTAINQVTFNNCHCGSSGPLQYLRSTPQSASTYVTTNFTTCLMVGVTLDLPSYSHNCLVYASGFTSITDPGTNNVIFDSGNFGSASGYARLGTVTNVHTVINVKDPQYGAVGDGVTDDTAAINAAIAASITQNTALATDPPTLFFPMGTYLISSTIVVDSGGPGSGHTNYFVWQGEMGGHGAYPGTTIRWNGAQYGTMFSISNARSVRISGINFDGGANAAICVNLRAFSTGTKWTNCAFINTISVPVWQPGAPYPQNTYVIASDSGFFQDNGHLYKATTGGTSGASAPVFPQTAGGTVTDGGVTWTEEGPSPACFAAGDLTGAFVGAQVDTSNFRDCYFQGAGFAVTSYGTSPPAVTFTGVGNTSAANNIGIIITFGGTLGVAQFTWTLNSVVQQTGQSTAASFVLGSTGLTAHFAAGTYSTTNFYVAGISTYAGWRCLSGANVKQFGFDGCIFISLGTGLDAIYGSDCFTLNACTAADNQCDLRCAGTAMVVNGFESEGSGYLLQGNIGTAAAAQCSFIACTWSGNTPNRGDFTNYGTGDAFIRFGGSMSFEGCEWLDSTNNFPLVIAAGANTGATSEAGSLRSRGTTYIFNSSYTGELFFPVFDSNTNAYISGTKQYYSGYGGGGLQFRVSSDGDFFVPSEGGTNVPIQRFDGQDLHIARQVLPAQPGASLASGVLTPTLGSMVGACAKFTIPFTAVHTGGLTNTLALSYPWNKTRIKAVYVNINTTFSGGSIATCTVEVGKQVPVSGSAVTNSYILATDVKSAVTTTTPIGASSGDLGADLATTVQGAALVWGTTDGNPTTTEQWVLSATFRSTVANLSALTQGNLDIYVMFEVLPGFNP